MKKSNQRPLLLIEQRKKWKQGNETERYESSANEAKMKLKKQRLHREKKRRRKKTWNKTEWQEGGRQRNQRPFSRDKVKEIKENKKRLKQMNNAERK